MISIVSILPKGEGFSPANFGAIALCVRDFTLHSQYKDTTTIIGGMAGPGFDGIHYYTPPRARWYQNRTRAYAAGCARYINSQNVTLAEIHNRPLILLLLARKAKCKFVLHLHNDPQEMEGAKTPEERRKLLKLCAGIYCVSGYIRERFLEGIEGGNADGVHVVHNGLGIPSHVPEKEKLIVFAGRMTEGKGALLLAQALTIALPSLSGWKAVFIGSCRHEVAQKLTPHEREIAAILNRLGDKVTMPGFLSHEQTLDYFARAEVAVVPSVWQEPFGRTAVEAMAYGCALISSGRGGLREVTADAAYTLADLTPESLAAAITILATDEAACKRLQLLARERAAYFSIAGCTKLLDKVRQKILAGKGL